MVRSMRQGRTESAPHAHEQRVVHQPRLGRRIEFGQIGRFGPRQSHVPAHEEVSVLYRIEKTAQQVVPSEKRLERIDPLHAEHLAEIGLQPLLPAEVILPVVGIKVADDVPAHRHIGHPHSPVREQPEDEAAPRGEAGLCAPVSVPTAPGIGEQAACRRRVESLTGQCMLDVEDSLAGYPIGIVLPGGRRRNGVPVFANERFIIRYVVGKSRDEEPREERNTQLP